MRYHVVAAAAFLAVVIPAVAQAPIRTERVEFARGTTSSTIKGTIKGDSSVDYKIGARAGQTLNVRLQSSNSSNYFNVIVPGADSAMFVGSMSGNSFTGTLPSSGDYTVRVYLMRNAARRGESANYTLTVGVTNVSNSAASAPVGRGSPITPGNLPAYCRGEVSSMYGTKPTYVKTGALAKAADGSSSISGTVDKGTEGIKSFKCRFDPNGRFIDVMAMTSDGE